MSELIDTDELAGPFGKLIVRLLGLESTGGWKGIRELAAECRGELLQQHSDKSHLAAKVAELQAALDQQRAANLDLATRLAAVSECLSRAAERGWGQPIPVSERMPEPDQRVLFYAPAFFLGWVAGHYNGRWRWDDGDLFKVREVTHWLPLPSAPPESQLFGNSE